MKKDNDGLKITHVEILNFKGIRHKDLEINGRSFKISGKNAAFKSSLMQAILSPLDSKSVPSEPITTGEEKASVKIKLAGVVNGDKQEYEIKIAFTQKNKKGTITLYDGEGNVQKSNKSIIDSIVGNISFDIFTFLNDTKDKQRKVLKQLAGVEDVVDEISARKKQLLADKLYLEKKIVDDESLLKNHGFTQDEIDTYSVPKTPEEMAALQSDVDGISKKIATYSDIKARTAAFKVAADNDDIAYNQCSIDQASSEKEIGRLEALIVAEKSKISAYGNKQQELIVSKDLALQKHEAGKVWLINNPEPSAKEASDALNAATIHNSKCEEVTKLAEKQKKLLTDKQKIAEYIESIAKCEDDTVIAYKNSKLPIKGLVVTDDNILYNNLPFEEGQINTAKFWEIGQEISMALNPNLRVILWKAASLLDTETQKIMLKCAYEKGYMVIAEVVNDSQESVVTFMEEEIKQAE